VSRRRVSLNTLAAQSISDTDTRDEPPSTSDPRCSGRPDPGSGRRPSSGGRRGGRAAGGRKGATDRPARTRATEAPRQQHHYSVVRRETGRLRDDQYAELTAESRRLNRLRGSNGQRITRTPSSGWQSTCCSRARDLAGADEAQLRSRSDWKAKTFKLVQFESSPGALSRDPVLVVHAGAGWLVQGIGRGRRRRAHMRLSRSAVRW